MIILKDWNFWLSLLFIINFISLPSDPFLGAFWFWHLFLGVVGIVWLGSLIIRQIARNNLNEFNDVN
jgi:hypothetical protein